MATKRKNECSPDPLEKLVAHGKIRTQPYTHYRSATTPTVDFELLANKIQIILSEAYQYHDPLCLQYAGTNKEIDQCLMSDILALIDFALCVLYNRLQAVAESYSSSTSLSRMKKRAPVDNKMVFPSFLSSSLSSIGPLRITDAGRDALVLYAPLPNTDNNYGRSQAHELVYGHYQRLINSLHSCGIGLSPIDSAIVKVPSGLLALSTLNNLLIS